MVTQWPWFPPLLFLAMVVMTFFLTTDRKKSRASRAPIPPAFEPDPLTPAHAVLAGFWAQDGDLPAPYGEAEAALCDLEQRYGVVLPEDFRAYLLTIAPAEDHWDQEDGIWWSPKRIRNIPQEYAHPLENPAIAARAERCLFFIDHLAWCWAWAICCEQGADYGKVAVIGDKERWVAGSFSDFVRTYACDPLSLN